MFVIFVLISLVGSINAETVSRVGNALTSELADNQFKAKLAEGFHFNDKAPNTLIIDGQSIKPATLAGRNAEFSGLPLKWSDGKARLYICDDAVTFCESRTVVLKEGQKKSKIKVEASHKTKGKVNKHGFIEDDYAQALAVAEKNNQLVLIDFAARWCPGCVRLEKEIFDTKEFKNLTKNFVKLKLDTDRFENLVHMDKYRIQGIPSLVVINPRQQEIDRFYDYQPIEFITGFFAGIQADPASIQELTEKAKFKDSQVLLRLGKRLLAAGRAKESADMLQQIQPPPPEYARARVEAAAALFEEDPQKKAAYIRTLRDMIQAEPNSTRSLDWREKLIGVLDNDKEKQKIKDEGVALADNLLAHPENISEAAKTDFIGEFTGFERFYIAMYRAGLANSDEGWAKAAEVGKESKIPLTQTGTNLRYIIALTQAKQFDEANKHILLMLKLNPNDPELKRRRLRALVGMKDYKEAIRLGQNVLAESYGRNEFYVAEVLAKAYLGADQKAQAKALIDRYLNRNEIHFPNMKMSKQSLEELKQKAI